MSNEVKDIKSIRWAFIRVTATNETKEGIVTYSKEDIEKILVDWNNKKNFQYWFIEHPKDDTVDKKHYHIVLKFYTPCRFSLLKKKFPYGRIERPHNHRKCLQYLVHMNNPDKTQYSWDDVISNSTIEPYKKDDPTPDEILKRIISGELKEHNLTDEISGEFFIKHKDKIKKALEYYQEKRHTDKTREIKVIFIQGGSGTGKSLFATNLCEKAGLSYALSSSSNDAVQDYRNEDVLILDDLREDSFSFSDLLKFLDNHNNSTIKSRYRNKAFFGELIIITSTVPLNKWYQSVKGEELYQLHRRIAEIYKMSKNNIDIYQIDDYQKKYVYVGTTPNPRDEILKERTKKREFLYEQLSLPLTKKLEKLPIGEMVNMDDIEDPDNPF